MKVILRKSIENLGDAGEIKEVKPGYGRNYLIPQGLAELATEGAIKNWKLGEEKRKAKLEKEVSLAKTKASKIEGTVLSFSREVGEDEKMFGSVGKSDIWKSLKASGHEIDREAIILTTPIKTIGDTDVVLKLRRGVETTVKVRIAPKAE